MNRLEVLAALLELDRGQVEITLRTNRFLPEIKKHLKLEIKKEKNENPIVLRGKLDVKAYLSETEAQLVIQGQITANRQVRYGEYVFSSYDVASITDLLYEERF